MRSLNISDHVFPSCFSGARIDISAEDGAVVRILEECPARPYAEQIKSGIPGPSSLKPARPAVLRPSPPSTMRVSPVGPSAATPTKGDVAVPLTRPDPFGRIRTESGMPLKSLNHSKSYL